MNGISQIFWIFLACSQSAGKQTQVAEEPRNVGELLACLERAAANLQDYIVTGVTEAGGKKQQFKLTFKRPNLVRIDSHDGQVSVQPNGEIKGRLGRGPVGKIAQKLGRDDKRLNDAEGIPFYESDFPSMLARVENQIKSGAVATMTSDASAYTLNVRSGDVGWKYSFDRRGFAIQESSRFVNGRQVEITHYTGFQPNTGVKTEYFRF